MSKTTTLLEKRVQQAVERLRELSEERQRLERELSDARERLERFELSAGAGGPAGEGEVEQARRTEALALVHEALDDLRAPIGSPPV